MDFELGDKLSIPLFIGATALFVSLMLDLSTGIKNIETIASNLSLTASKELVLLNSFTIITIGVLWSFGHVYSAIGMVRNYFNPSSEVGN